ncbi:hypothetical protein JR316_0002753 [Psilocybe cubensis]|uniref:Uncharacterized protein n=2 Tax=Psilocybe cubensis TaxID=181762 RepID=A0A8H7Y8V7_PSICU|nr:hypothetical protein JR316_0002753 [Psilocybe cubensis]KAH9485838.1 hypothetical protein JR316_0002753 [Psilocybe cubensis]
MSLSSSFRATASPTSFEFDPSDFADEIDSSTSSRTSTSSTFVTSAVVSSSASQIFFTSASSARLSPSTNIAFRTQTQTAGSLSPSISSLPTNTPQTSSSSSSGLGQGEVALIAGGSLLFLLGLAAAIIIFLRHRRNRALGRSGSRSKQNGFEEKYADEAQYTSYSVYRKSLSDPGMAPLLRIPSIGQLSKIHSDSDAESHLYQDGPHSPFTNEGENVAPTHAVTMAESTPPRPSQDGQFEAVSLIPVVGTSSTSRSVPKLPPLQIPEYRTTPPPVRGSSLRSKSPVQQAPLEVHDSGCDSDDSASLYSQASASTQRTTRSYAALRQGVIPTLQYPSMPLPSIPQSPSHKPSGAVNPAQPIRESVTVNTLPTPPEFGITQNDKVEEANGGIEVDETLFVAKLLQSRQSRVPNAVPTRNASIVSHIERADSIKPALGRGAGSRHKRARRARDVVNSQVLAQSPTDYMTPSAYLTSSTSNPSQSSMSGVAPLSINKNTRPE